MVRLRQELEDKACFIIGTMVLVIILSANAFGRTYAQATREQAANWEARISQYLYRIQRRFLIKDFATKDGALRVEAAQEVIGALEIEDDLDISDSWGRPWRIVATGSQTDGRQSETPPQTSFMLYSVGANGKDERGSGDDITSRGFDRWTYLTAPKLKLIAPYLAASLLLATAGGFLSFKRRWYLASLCFVLCATVSIVGWAIVPR